MIKSGFRGKPYVLCLKNVEIEPLRTYVVISLQLSAWVQGLVLAVKCSCKAGGYQSLAILI